MAPLSVRRAVPSDVPGLAVLFDQYRQFYGRPTDLSAARDFLLQRLQSNESVVFLACGDEPAPVGFTQLYPSFSSVSLARVWVLNDLFVASSGRKQGVGARLLAAAADFARAEGAVRLTLSTALDNRDAQRLYEAAGWQRDSQFRVYHLPLGAG
ncbi:MAG: GNAT family N-acetyltransferase [Pseudomonadota bacterium]